MRVIDADALLAKLEDWRGDQEDVDVDDAHDVAYYSAMSRAIRFAKDAPTLDLAPKWISVKDRLPEEGRSVLVHYVDGWMPVAHLLNGKWYQSGGETNWLSVTHWMPLPEPPKEG